jgi:hypothetical protein
MAIIDVASAILLASCILLNVLDSNERSCQPTNLLLESLIISFQIVHLDPAFVVVLLGDSDGSR